MNKYLFAGLGALAMTALLFSFVIVAAGAGSRGSASQHLAAATSAAANVAK